MFSNRNGQFSSTFKLGIIYVFLRFLVRFLGVFWDRYNLCIFALFGTGYEETAEKVTFFKNANPLSYENQSNINIYLPQ